MKKPLVILLAGVTALSLTACGSQTTTNDTLTSYTGTDSDEADAGTQEDMSEEISETESTASDDGDEDESGFTEFKLDGYTTVYHLGKGAEVVAEFATGNLTSEVQPDADKLAELYASNNSIPEQYYEQVVVLKNNNDYPVVFNGTMTGYKDDEEVFTVSSYDDYGYTEPGEISALLFDKRRGSSDAIDRVEVTVGFTELPSITDTKTYDTDRDVKTVTYQYSIKGVHYTRSFFSMGVDSTNYSSTQGIVIQRWGDIVGASIFSYNSDAFAACSSIAQTGLFDNYIVIPMVKFGDTEEDVGIDMEVSDITSIEQWFTDNDVEATQIESMTTYTIYDYLNGNAAVSLEN